MGRENRISTTYHALQEAINLRKKLRDRSEDDSWTPDWYLVLSTLKPDKAKKWIHCVSSYNHGAYILDQVFPKSENPDDFHSTEFEVDLSDDPIQVLGWNDVEKLKQEAQKIGLNRDWMELGFEWRAQERGIDLEWHFFATPPQTGNELSSGNKE